MKHFYMVKTEFKRGKQYFKAFGIKNNKLFYLASGEYAPSSTRGAESELMTVAATKGHLPKKYTNTSLYHCDCKTAKFHTLN